MRAQYINHYTTPSPEDVKLLRHLEWWMENTVEPSKPSFYTSISENVSFRTGMSAAMAVSRVVNSITNALESKETVSIVFIDLTIGFNILIIKLQFME